MCLNSCLPNYIMTTLKASHVSFKMRPVGTWNRCLVCSPLRRRPSLQREIFRFTQELIITAPTFAQQKLIPTKSKTTAILHYFAFHILPKLHLNYIILSK